MQNGTNSEWLTAQSCTDIQRFGHTIWTARHYESNVFVMLAYTSYFDASSRPKHPMQTVVAGYASPVHMWERFEIDWKIALAKFEVPYFHMKEFAASQGPYRDPTWKNEGKRARFLSVLAEITKSYTMVGIARLLPHSVFDEVNKKYRLDERFNPFAICARDCAIRAYKHIRQLYSDTAPIEYIFDQGDEGKGLLMNEMERYGLPLPIFRHSKPVVDKPEIVPTVQLQCCDFAAWELRKASVTQDDASFKKYRKSLQALQDVKTTTWKRYTNLDDLCQQAEIELRPAVKNT